MDYPRFFIPEEKVFGGKFSLENPQDVKKVRQVLRLKEKDKIILLNNLGKEYLAKIEKSSKEAVKGSIVHTSESLNRSSSAKLDITLAQALPKGSKMGDIIRMNTELGVEKFIPFESEHSVIKLNKFNPKKLERWRKIAKSASEQSERHNIPEISEPIKFEELLKFDANLDSHKFEYKLLFHSRQVAGNKNIVDVKSSFKNVTTSKTNVVVSIGPEGGFSQKEVSLAKNNGWTIVWIDLPILRTETAGVVICGYLLIY